MKKIFSISMLVAAAAMAFVSCQKQVIPTQDTVTISGLTFTSEKPALDGETKTAWDGSTIKWVRTDKIYVGYTCDEIWQNKAGNAASNQEAKIYQSNILDDAGVETGKFHLPDDFTFSGTGSKTFYGIYPSTVISSEFAEAPAATITIPSTQTPAENSFDSTADFMIGVSDALTQITPEQEISLKWTRQVAHAQITLTAISGYASGEAVQTIKLTANSDADMVGKYSVPLDSPAFTKDGSNTEPNVLTIKGTNLTAASRTANVNGADKTVYDVTFWASFLPCTVTSLDVVVETDKATYTRNITTCDLNFKQNMRNILSIDMSGATRVEKAAEVVLYTETFGTVISDTPEFSKYDGAGSTTYDVNTSLSYSDNGSTDKPIKIAAAASNIKNVEGPNLMVQGKFFAKISGIATHGSTKVTVTWSANNDKSSIFIEESIPGTAAVKSSANAANTATFTLNETPETITLTISSNSTSSAGRVDNIKIVKAN